MRRDYSDGESGHNGNPERRPGRCGSGKVQPRDSTILDARCPRITTTRANAGACQQMRAPVTARRMVAPNTEDILLES
jgi:hypothetical protein